MQEIHCRQHFSWDNLRFYCIPYLEDLHGQDFVCIEDLVHVNQKEEGKGD